VLINGLPGISRYPGSFASVKGWWWELFSFDLDEFGKFAICNAFVIVQWSDLWRCGTSPFDGFVRVWFRARYGDPDRIVVCFKWCGACNFGVDDALSKRHHDVIASACHRLSSCAVFVPCICPVFPLFKNQYWVT